MDNGTRPDPKVIADLFKAHLPAPPPRAPKKLGIPTQSRKGKRR